MLREGRRDGGSLVRLWGGGREFLSPSVFFGSSSLYGGQVDRMVVLMIDTGLNSG